MSDSTKDLLFSFIPLGGWVASRGADAYWQQIGILDLIFAIGIATFAIVERFTEGRQLETGLLEAED